MINRRLLLMNYPDDFSQIDTSNGSPNESFNGSRKYRRSSPVDEQIFSEYEDEINWNHGVDHDGDLNEPTRSDEGPGDERSESDERLEDEERSGDEEINQDDSKIAPEKMREVQHDEL